MTTVLERLAILQAASRELAEFPRRDKFPHSEQLDFIAAISQVCEWLTNKSERQTEVTVLLDAIVGTVLGSKNCDSLADFTTEAMLQVQPRFWTAHVPMPGGCRLCGVCHHPDTPHELFSPQFELLIALSRGRAANYEDAIADCPEQVQILYMELLKRYGQYPNVTLPVDPRLENEYAGLTLTILESLKEKTT